MICPSCGHDGFYQGFISQECANPKCQFYKAPKIINNILGNAQNSAINCADNEKIHILYINNKQGDMTFYAFRSENGVRNAAIEVIKNDFWWIEKEIDPDNAILDDSTLDHWIEKLADYSEYIYFSSAEIEP